MTWTKKPRPEDAPAFSRFSSMASIYVLFLFEPQRFVVKLLDIGVYCGETISFHVRCGNHKALLAKADQINTSNGMSESDGINEAKLVDADDS